jgi:hypothetical protein
VLVCDNVFIAKGNSSFRSPLKIKFMTVV